VSTPEQPEADEQVVGVLKWCEACGEKTVHVNGVCRDHRVVRRRKQPLGARAAAILANPTAAMRSAVEDRRAGLAAEAAQEKARKKAKAKRAAERRNKVRTVVGLVVVAAVVVAIGFMHVVHGTNLSIHVCAKYGWSLSDTIVDVDDYPAGPTRHDTRVGVALDQCKL
jgi:hypothetical protein